MSLLASWQRLEDSFHPHSRAFLGIHAQDFEDNLWLPLATAAAYVVALVVGLAVMERRRAFDLRVPLAAWNFFLAAFSVAGCARTAPVLLGNLARHPFRRSLCEPAALDWGRGACGLWVQLFILSKFAELADTAFIVARKKRLLFLHWYHHLTVLLYCWHAYAKEAPHALYFVAMNYGVHGVMYSYYGLMALGAKPAWFAPEVVTGAQILQMVVGVSVQVCAFRADCGVDAGNLLAGALMYASYLALFCKFAADRFLYKKYRRGGIASTFSGSAPAGNPWKDALPVMTHLLKTFRASVRRSLSQAKLAQP